MSSNTSLPTDLSIFKDIEPYEVPSCNDYKECIAMRRLLTSLRYYSSLQLQTNKDNQEIFINFTKEVYPHPILIQDYHYFQKKYDNQLHEIMKYAIDNGICEKCNIDTCNYSSRHYRIQTENTNISMDPYLRFYGETLDSLHFYLLHLHQVGLRCINHTDSIGDNDSDDNKANEAYDAEFARLNSDISSTHNSSNRFSRISTGNKFKIELKDTVEDPAPKQRNIPKVSKIECDITYLDTVIDELHAKNVDEPSIIKLINYLKQEKYDTESVDIDLQIDKGNIANHMTGSNEQCLMTVIQKFNDSRVSSGAFSIGFEYDYWAPEKDLFIKRKYKNLKEEMMNYQHLDLQQYQEEILPKTDIIHQTNLCQSMVTDSDNYNKPPEYVGFDWGIPKDEVISKDRIISIILYTDYSTLSAHFTSTFRKSNTFEPIQATIQRHRNYYWWARKLRETVKVYGSTYEYDDTFRGPFYCGMSFVMTMPRFSMELYSPTSTSCQIAVALKFSGNAGLIMEFNNNVGSSTMIPGFDVSWISAFKEEDERPLNLASIRIIQSNLNLRKYIQAITAFDCMLSANIHSTNKIPETARYGDIVSHLVADTLSNDSRTSDNDRKLHRYIYQTFKTFIQNKEKLEIDIYNISQYVKDRKLSGLFFDSIVKYKLSGTPDITSWLYMEDVLKQNMIKSQIFELLPNIKEIHIFFKFGYYPFPLLALLSRIENTSINKVRICIGERKPCSLLDKCPGFPIIQDKFKEQQFEIKIDHFMQDILINKY